MYRHSTVSVVTKIFVDILFYLGIPCVIAVPFFIYLFDGKSFFGIPELIKTPFTLVLMASGVCAVYILFELKLIFQTLLGESPFVLENVTSLKKIAYTSFVISALYIIKCLFWFTAATFIIIIIFFIAGLFCLTLGEVFSQAIAYKEENDMTI